MQNDTTKQKTTQDIGRDVKLRFTRQEESTRKGRVLLSFSTPIQKPGEFVEYKKSRCGSQPHTESKNVASEKADWRTYHNMHILCEQVCLDTLRILSHPRDRRQAHLKSKTFLVLSYSISYRDRVSPPSHPPFLNIAHPIVSKVSIY